MEQEQSNGFQVFDINPQIVAKGKKTTTPVAWSGPLFLTVKASLSASANPNKTVLPVIIAVKT